MTMFLLKSRLIEEDILKIQISSDTEFGKQIGWNKTEKSVSVDGCG